MLNFILLLASSICAVGPMLSLYYIFMSCHDFTKEANLCKVFLNRLNRSKWDKNFNKLVKLINYNQKIIFLMVFFLSDFR